MADINTSNINVVIGANTNINTSISPDVVVAATIIEDQQPLIQVTLEDGLLINTSINTGTTYNAIVTNGARGKTGKSAYEVWLEEGHTGSQGDFLAWLQTTNNFVFETMVPLDTWNIIHNMGKCPSVSVVNSAGTWVIGDVQYIDNTRLIVTFQSEFSGKAYLN